MPASELALDKHLEAEAGAYGKIGVRVVVLKAKAKEGKPAREEPQAEDDEPAPTGDSPLSSYLENPKGKQCVVFLVNGQRHHAWDNTFLSRDLPFKYLKVRTMIVVDLDGLAPHALAEVIRGSRQGLFEGDVYYAVRERLVSMLKKDQDLDALQKEAEQKYLEMDAGDAAVKNKLDQLIEGHHIAASQLAGLGFDGIGTQVSNAPHFTDSTNMHDVVVMGDADAGQAATLPVLVTEPRMVSVRLQDGQTKEVLVTSSPRDDWPKVEELTAKLDPEHNGLSLVTLRESGGARLTLSFNEPPDRDSEEYPLTSHLFVYARFKGYLETRMLKVPVVVVKPKDKPPKEPKPLKDDPTFLKVISRKPIKLVPGGASVHVKLLWDGKDTLLIGSPPPWRFGARCLTLSTFPNMGFAVRGGGRLGLLLDTPNGILPGSELEFEVEANGPDGKRLAAKFKAVITDKDEDDDELGPRKITAQSPDTAGQRRPPFEPKYVSEPDWPNGGCWGDNVWTGEDVGCFQEPTATAAGFIVMNRDMALLKNYREEMVKKKLEEATIKERMNRYYSIVGFHLYQIYVEYKRRLEAAANDPEIKVPSPEEMRGEINRVGTSLVRIMELSR
jgi:hypothetical protein